MTTLTIPTKFGYPKFDIYINGKRYTLQSGVEITVEDHVAEVIENAIALAPKLVINKSKLAQLADGTLTELTIADLDGIKTIVSYSFRNCYSLTSIEIPDSVTSIGDSAIFGCSKLKSVRFGSNSNLASIAAHAFEWCSLLEEMYLPKTPPTLDNINAFDNIKSTCVFYCKSQESLNAYKSAANWSTLINTYTFKVESK